MEMVQTETGLQNLMKDFVIVTASSGPKVLIRNVNHDIYVALERNCRGAHWQNTDIPR